MKKTILLTSILAVGAAFADPTEVMSGNAVGALNVSIGQSAAQTLVAVPFLGYAEQDKVAVKDMVKTSNLGHGSKLYVPDGTGKYNTWTLNAQGEWVADELVTVVSGGQPVVGTAPNQADATVNRGDAFWIEPKSAGMIYLLGQATTAAGTCKVAKGWNLIGNTDVTADSKTVIVTGASDNDQIVVQVDGKLRYYTYKAAKASWASLDGSGKLDTNPPVLAPGQGLWYFGKSSNTVVNW